ncbi:MAG: Smr/MutS family protein [Gammaproteobacteria bacterium]
MPRKKPSKADSDLFRNTVGDVIPMADDRVPPTHRRRKPVPRSRQQDDAQVMRELLSDLHDPAELETGDELLYLRPGLQHGVFRKLRRGQFSVGAELDLHGMTVPVARQALHNFLHRCAGTGIRCVRIIHGKGYGSQQRQPILKNKVNHWLRQWDSVLAFCSTPPRDGGTGAMYVLLKGAR